MTPDTLMGANNVVIQIDWPWILGIFGTLIGLAWYGSARFTRIESAVENIKENIRDIYQRLSSPPSTQLFETHSPLNLNKTGEEWLRESGLKEFIDSNKEELISECEKARKSNPYEVQKKAYSVMDKYEFEEDVDDRLKQFAFEKGSTMSILRRVGGIYLRNLCLERFGMRKEDIDIHDPDAKKKL